MTDVRYIRLTCFPSQYLVLPFAPSWACSFPLSIAQKTEFVERIFRSILGAHTHTLAPCRGVPNLFIHSSENEILFHTANTDRALAVRFPLPRLLPSFLGLTLVGLRVVFFLFLSFTQLGRCLFRLKRGRSRLFSLLNEFGPRQKRKKKAMSCFFFFWIFFISFFS